MPVLPKIPITKGLRRQAVRLSIAVCALPALVMATAAPSHAAPSEMDDLTRGACGAAIPGAYVEVYTHWVNNDMGSKVTFHGNASAAVKRCSTGAVMPYAVKLKWNVVANGFGIDSCSLSFRVVVRMQRELEPADVELLDVDHLRLPAGGGPLQLRSLLQRPSHRRHQPGLFLRRSLGRLQQHRAAAQGGSVQQCVSVCRWLALR